MLLLYATPLSSYSAKVALALEAKGLFYERRLPQGGSYKSAEHCAINPLGTVPVLQDDETILVESDAIIEYLDDIYPGWPLLPKDAVGRARARALSRFHDLYLEPPVRALFAQAAPATRDAGIVAEKTHLISQRLAQLEAIAQPAPYFGGANFGFADCGFPPTLLWIDLLLPALGAAAPQYGPKVTAWRATVAADPVVQKIMVPYRAVAEAWLAEKLRG